MPSESSFAQIQKLWPARPPTKEILRNIAERRYYIKNQTGTSFHVWIHNKTIADKANPNRKAFFITLPLTLKHHFSLFLYRLDLLSFCACWDGATIEVRMNAKYLAMVLDRIWEEALQERHEYNEDISMDWRSETMDVWLCIEGRVGRHDPDSVEAYIEKEGIEELLSNPLLFDWNTYMRLTDPVITGREYLSIANIGHTQHEITSHVTAWLTVEEHESLPFLQAKEVSASESGPSSISLSQLHIKDGGASEYEVQRMTEQGDNDETSQQSPHKSLKKKRRAIVMDSPASSENVDVSDDTGRGSKTAATKRKKGSGKGRKGEAKKKSFEMTDIMMSNIEDSFVEEEEEKSMPKRKRKTRGSQDIPQDETLGQPPKKIAAKGRTSSRRGSTRGSASSMSSRAGSTASLRPGGSSSQRQSFVEGSANDPPTPPMWSEVQAIDFEASGFGFRAFQNENEDN